MNATLLFFNYSFILGYCNSDPVKFECALNGGDNPAYIIYHHDEGLDSPREQLRRAIRNTTGLIPSNFQLFQSFPYDLTQGMELDGKHLSYSLLSFLSFSISPFSSLSILFVVRMQGHQCAGPAILISMTPNSFCYTPFCILSSSTKVYCNADEMLTELDPSFPIPTFSPTSSPPYPTFPTSSPTSSPTPAENTKQKEEELSGGAIVSHALYTLFTILFNFCFIYILVILFDKSKGRSCNSSNSGGGCHCWIFSVEKQTRHSRPIIFRPKSVILVRIIN